MSAAGGTSGSTENSTAPLSSSVLGIAIVAITGMQLMATLDGTIVIVALPRMQADLDLSDAGKSWVITAYVLTFGGLLLLGGRVGDAIGQKRAFLSGVGVFTIASLICGLAGTSTRSSPPAPFRASARPSPPRPAWRSSPRPTPSDTRATRPWRSRRACRPSGR